MPSDVTPSSTPHYVRFARALALVSIAASVGSCEQVRSQIGCEHCHCSGGPASFSRPVNCDYIDPTCCMPVEGPLPPPDLPV